MPLGAAVKRCEDHYAELLLNCCHIFVSYAIDELFVCKIGEKECLLCSQVGFHCLCLLLARFMSFR